MSRVFYRIFPLLLITLCTTVDHTLVATALARSNTSTSGYLSLEVTPTRIPVGGVVTLRIIYYPPNGLPRAPITIEPNDAFFVDLSSSTPCPHYGDPYTCRDYTLYTQKIGHVTIDVNADNEIYDTGCMCWYWVYNDASADLTITSGVFLPVVRR